MAKQIDNLKKAQYRKLRLQGIGKGKALETIGYAKTTAYHKQNDLKLVKVGESEIAKGFKMQDLTPEKVLAEIEEAQAIANSQNDVSAMLKGSEMKGRYLAMFSDKLHVDVKDITERDKLLLDTLHTQAIELPMQVKPIPLAHSVGKPVEDAKVINSVEPSDNKGKLIK